ncbi:MAG: hypothetical protein C4520_12155 [Candidatus Abyssobacteria bacterium SURF_5]|uniref:Uncharacterized protein n=1 Tax=Abyssobacteria bacterium (strain SURF_5) TaxID=2093360 RepID=A0A3A4NVK3_ABYX5|nr:MAG: hypothetical protein C4520_12155 [Candidatus Abyssubacteria bacterium SURF_5]
MKGSVPFLLSASPGHEISESVSLSAFIGFHLRSKEKLFPREARGGDKTFDYAQDRNDSREARDFIVQHRRVSAFIGGF